MNCQDVQGHLSGYLDLSLSTTQLTAIDAHINACSPCRDDAELLRETIQQVRLLPLLEPPLGFSQRVMSHVCEAHAEPGFWHRILLLVTPRVTAPALALAAVGVVSIYLLQEEPNKQVVATAPETPPAIEPASEPRPEPVPAPFQLAEATPATTQPARETPSRTAVKRSRKGEQVAAATAEVRQQWHPEGERSFQTPVPDINVRPTPVGTGQPVGRSGSPAGSGTIPFPAEPELPLFRHGAPSIEPFADLEIIVRRHAVSRLVPRVQIDTSESAASARPIERLSAAIPDHTRPQTIWVSIPHAQFEEFKREILYLGNIESESRVPMLRAQSAGQGDGHIRVKLTAVPAAEITTSSPTDQR